MAEPEKGERRQLTVLFCDLVGSTDLAARLDPEEYREALRTYYARVSQVLTRYGGCLAQHLGDGLLVYFGWPETYDDAAERAVRAALEVVAATATVEAGGAPAVEIDAAFARALDGARQCGAKTYELRTATSYARWLCEHDRAAAAWDLLAPLHTSFSEGCDTRDLRQAGDLLARWSDPAGPLPAAEGHARSQTEG